MNIDQFVSRLDELGLFASVEGISALSVVKDVPLGNPAAFVFEAESAAGPNERMNGVLQRVESDIAVVIVVQNDTTALGGAALMEAQPLEDAVLRSLLGWQPAGVEDVVTFVRAVTVKARAGQVWRELTFAVATYLED